jgi:hypothetical protein
VLVVFLNSPYLYLYRETPKDALKKAGCWVGLGFSKCTGGGVEKKLAAPRGWEVGSGKWAAGSGKWEREHTTDDRHRHSELPSWGYR